MIFALIYSKNSRILCTDWRLKLLMEGRLILSIYLRYKLFITWLLLEFSEVQLFPQQFLFSYYLSFDETVLISLFLSVLVVRTVGMKWFYFLRLFSLFCHLIYLMRILVPMKKSPSIIRCIKKCTQFPKTKSSQTKTIFCFILYPF